MSDHVRVPGSNRPVDRLLLEPLRLLPTELHTFRAGSANYGQTPSECFYCWEPEAVHEQEACDG